MAIESKLTQETIDALEKEHDEIYVVRGAARSRSDNTQYYPWEVVLRAPNRREYKKYKATIFKDSTSHEAVEILVTGICVWPSSEAFDALLEKFPAIPEACFGAVSHLVGSNIDEASKK